MRLGHGTDLVHLRAGIVELLISNFLGVFIVLLGEQIIDLVLRFLLKLVGHVDGLGCAEEGSNNSNLTKFHSVIIFVILPS